MKTLFFFGTLRHAPLLDLVLGRATAPVAASLPGYRVVWAEGESFPMMIEAPGEQAEGVVLAGLSDDDVARLDFYEGAFAYRLVTVTAQTGAGPVEALVYMPHDAPWHPGAPWSLADWQARWGALTMIAAAEVMRAFGRMSAEDIGHRLPIIRARAQAQVSAAARRRPVTLSSPLTRDDVVLDHHAIPYEKFFTVEEMRARYRRFDGSWGQTGDRAIFQVADAVTVLPYDPVQDRVMLIEQLRVGVYASGDPQPWLLEPIAGIVDAGESFEATAHREAMEEAHVELSALHHVAGYYPTPGGVAQYLVSYVGIAHLPDEAPRIGGIEGEGENIRNLLVGFKELVGMLEAGELVNAPLLLSVQWLMLNRDRLRG